MLDFADMSSKLAFSEIISDTVGMSKTKHTEICHATKLFQILASTT
jgi:hypothetical protein